MKKIALTLKLLFVINVIFCQVQNDYIENIVLEIDRNIYVTGEPIEFWANILCNSNPSDTALSQVLYVELITPDNKQIVGNKYYLKSSQLSSKIIIPKDINSGNYYLRAYTKYMRNWGPSVYAYQFIKIVNPYNSDILNGLINEATDTNWSLIDSFKQDSSLQIDLKKNTYSQRDQINFEIQNKSNSDLTNIIVTVVPKSSLNSQSLSWSGNISKINDYFPETRGITITGLCKDNNTDELIQHKKINLSILENKKNEFYSVNTNSEGKFYFTLEEYYGKKDIFISTENIKNVSPHILIDNDFCRQELQLPNPKFHLSNEEKSVAYKFAINQKVNDLFFEINKTNVNVNTLNNFDSIPFYGKPTNILYIDDYISLPSLEDYFTEIPFLVRLRKSDEGRKFKILGTHPELSIYEPLVMVDLVPINNTEDVLAISPKKISRIEAITSPYVKGDIIYGGIMNIISINNDLAGIKLPDSGIFLNYQFFSKIDNKLNDNKDTIDDNLPDPRNTLYWNSKIKLKINDIIKLTFITGDTKDNYIIKVIALNTEGKILRTSKLFIVE